MVKPEKLRYYFWNSYRFYAYGVMDEWTKHLTPPQWYIELGRTPAERQKNYRDLFRKYLEQTTVSWRQFLGYFIGEPLWVQQMESTLKERLLAGAIVSTRASPA